MHLDFTTPAIDHIIWSILPIQYAQAWFFLLFFLNTHTFILVQFTFIVCHYQTGAAANFFFFFFSFLKQISCFSKSEFAALFWTKAATQQAGYG